MGAKKISDWQLWQGVIQSGLIDEVQRLLDRGVPVDGPEYDRFGSTPLTMAIAAGQRDMVERLIKADASVNVRSRAVGGVSLPGDGPLHVAVWHGHLDIVRLLLACGADRSLLNGDAERPVDIALRCGNQEIIDLLSREGTLDRTPG